MSSPIIKKDGVHRCQGFTIIEALVSMLILSIGLTPALFVAVAGVRAADNIKNNIIASNLLQEGLETVRFLRDQNWLMCNDFSTGLVGGPWLIEYSSEWTNCGSRTLTSAGASPAFLKISPAGLYNYPSGNATIFRRTVTITSANGGNELVVSGIVYWSSGAITMTGCPAGTRCVKAESHLYNWK